MDSDCSMEAEPVSVVLGADDSDSSVQPLMASSGTMSLKKDTDTSSGLGSESDDHHDSLIVWKKGDKCLAKYSEDGTLYESKIRHIYKNERGHMMALVSFLGYSSDNDEELKCSALKPIARKHKKVSAKKFSKDPGATRSMFSPLQGTEEQKRLKDKFRALEEEEELERASQKTQRPWKTTSRRLLDTPTRAPPSRSRKRKMAVAVGGEEKSQRSQRTPRSQTGERSVTPSTGRSSTGGAQHTKTKDEIVSGGESEDPLATLDISAPAEVVGRRRNTVRHTGLTSESESEEEQSGRTGFEDEDMEKPRFGHITPGAKVPLVLSEDGEQPVIQVPATINQYLRDYQKQGIQFLYKHYKNNCGSILGDDMGLGKTVQVIGFIAAILKKTGTRIDVMRQKPLFIRKMSDNCFDYEDDVTRKPFLIIGPASVLYNWVDELDTWGHFTVGKFHQSHKDQTLADLKKNKLDVVVTTFETCRDNVAVLNKFQWDAVFADEAHKIKGLKAEVTQALRRLKCTKRYGLTGTPLQNKLEELWCLLDWATPGCLQTLKTFKDTIVKKIEKGQKLDATKRELAEARKAQEKLTQFREKWLLRRTKHIIANELPNIEELVVFCKPTDLQTDIYKTILSQDDMQYILTQNNPCDCDDGRGLTRSKCCYKMTPSGEEVRTLTFTYLHLCLKTANHIALLLPEKSVSEKQQEGSARVTRQVFAHHPQFVQQSKEASFRTLSDPKYCGKMKVLQGLLSVFKKQKSKVLLFSYSTMLLDIVETYVMSKGYEYRRLDGSTPGHRRVQLVREFNNTPSLFLFLSSTKAGGIGLNLTGANIVIIFDPNWNPTHDLQAQDRAYRIGQRRDVQVFRLICSGTIEENVYLRQVYKQQLGNVAVSDHNAKRYFQGVQGDTKNKGELFGWENMFTVRTGDRCLTEDILKRQNKIEAGLKAFNVARYVPSSHESKQDEEEEEVLPPAESDSESDDDDRKTGSLRRKASGKPSQSAKDDYGAGYICTQMFGLYCSDDDTSTNSHISARKRERTSDSDSDVPRSRTRAKKRGTKHVLSDSSSDNDDDSTVEHHRRRSKSEPCQCIDCQDPKPSTSGYRGRHKSEPCQCTDSDCHDPKPSTSGYRPRGRHKSEPCQCTDCQDPKPSTSGYRPRGRHKSETYRNKTDTEPQHRKSAVKGRLRFAEDSDSGGESPERKKVRSKVTDTKKVKSKVTFQAAEAATFASVSDVFDQCGVVHIHENHKITGASRAEDHMSRCAIQDVYELHQHSQMPAGNCLPFSETESSEESDAPPSPPKSRQKKGKMSAARGGPSGRGRKKKECPQGPRMQVVGNKKVLIGQTPKGIRRSQFQSLALSLDEKDPVSLARRLLYSSKEQQRHLLRTFYGSQDPSLLQVFPEPTTDQGDEDGGRSKTAGKGRKKGGKVPRPPPTATRRKPATVSKGGCVYDDDQEDSDTDTDTEVKDKGRSRSKAMKVGSRCAKVKQEQRMESVDTEDEDIEELLADVRDTERRKVRDSKVVRMPEVDPDISDLLDEIEATGRQRSRTSRGETRKVEFSTGSKKRGDHQNTHGAEAGSQPGGDHRNTHRTMAGPEPLDKKEEETFAFLDDIFFDDFVKQKSPQKRKVEESRKLDSGGAGAKESHRSTRVGGTKESVSKTGRESVVDVDDLLDMV